MNEPTATALAYGISRTICCEEEAIDVAFVDVSKQLFAGHLFNLLSSRSCPWWLKGLKAALTCTRLC
jgi:hypothetical protein